jgi:hypothetical protein
MIAVLAMQASERKQTMGGISRIEQRKGMSGFEMPRFPFLMFFFLMGVCGGALRGQETSPKPVSPLDQRLQSYVAARAEQIGRLIEGYDRALNNQFDRAADAGDLTLSSAFKREREHLQALKQVLATPGNDLASLARKPPGLPELAPDAPEALAQLRATWTTESSKIDTKLGDALIQSLKTLESELTKARDLEMAQTVLGLRSVVEANRTGAPGGVVGTGTPAAMAATGRGSDASTDRAGEATPERPFVNGLKMRFVPIGISGGPTAGKKILFSVWETRVSDYSAYAKRNRKADLTWENLNVSGYVQEENHPVVAVNWADAKAFCEWLTADERRSGAIGPADRYRLPSDHEWSCAAGIGELEDATATPMMKRGAMQEKMWWGSGWPPAEVFGNFCGEDTTFRVPVPTYRDGFPFTAPVGSFPKDQISGLFDLAGNATEWCEDLLDPAMADKRVVRGGSWARSTPDRFAICNRYHDQFAIDRQPDFGFRCVLELDAGP